MSKGRFSGPLTKQVLQMHTGKAEERALDRLTSNSTHTASASASVANVETQSVANSEFRDGDDPFLPIRRLANSSLLTHKQTLAVLAAVEEIIDETTKKRSPTSYFAALMIFLEQQKDVTPAVTRAKNGEENGEADDAENQGDEDDQDNEDDDEAGGDYIKPSNKGKKGKGGKRQHRGRGGKGGKAAQRHNSAQARHIEQQQAQEQEQEQDLTTAIFQLLAITFQRS